MVRRKEYRLTRSPALPTYLRLQEVILDENNEIRQTSYGPAQFCGSIKDMEEMVAAFEIAKKLPVLDIWW